MTETFKRYRIHQLKLRQRKLMNLIGTNMDSYEDTGDEEYKEVADRYAAEYDKYERKIKELEESWWLFFFLKEEKMFILLEMYLILGVIFLLAFYKIDEEVREKINKVLKEYNIFSVIFGMTIVIILTPIAVIISLLKREK